MSRFQTRAADVADAPAIQQLLPRLADFPSPARLTTEDVWRYDGIAVVEWAAGDRPQTWVGLGQQLMDEIEADGSERGATVMSLNVMATNERARSLYERLGFEEEMIRASKPLR